MLAGCKLLVADDSVTVQKVVDLTFSDEGCTVIAVSDGRQALEAIERSLPDIVLVDVTMPGVTGYEICAHIKRNDRTRHVPVILLVGAFENFNEAEARRVGADDVLTKPFQSIREMVNKVGNLFGGGNREAVEGAHEETDTPPAKATEPLTSQSSFTSAIFDLKPDADAPNLAAVDASSDERSSSSDLSSTETHDDSRPTSMESFDDSLLEADNPKGSDQNLVFADENSDDTARESVGAPEMAAFDDDDRNIEITPLGEETGDDSLSTNTMVSDAEGDNDENLIGDSSQVHTAQELDFAAEGDSPEPPARTEMMTNDDMPSGLHDSTPATANASDDALLDLGDFTSPPVASTEGAEDSYSDGGLLDLPEEKALPFASQTHDALESAEQQEHHSTMLPSEAASNFIPLDDATPPEERLDDTAHEESLTTHTESPVTGTVVGQAATTHTDAPPSSSRNLITLDNLAPEVIEEIVRRVVEQLSERAVQEIAWEVVPALAERMIKRRLETDEQGL